MITKQELDKLKELAKAATPGPWCRAPIFKSDWPSKRTDVAIVRGVRIIGPYANIPCGDEADYVINASPDTVLRLIEALEVATEALKRHYLIECVYCVGEGTTEEAPDFQNAYGEHGLHTKACLLCRPAKEALNKIYG